MIYDWISVTGVGDPYEQEVSPSTGQYRHRPLPVGGAAVEWRFGPAPSVRPSQEAGMKLVVRPKHSGLGYGMIICLFDDDGRMLPNQSNVVVDAGVKGATVTVTFVIDGRNVRIEGSEE